METREGVSNFVEKDGKSAVHEEKLCIRDNVERGKIIVVVSAAQVKTPTSNEYPKKQKINDVNLVDLSASIVQSLASENFNDDKENLREKCITGESRLSHENRETNKIFSQQQQQRTRTNRSPRHESVSIPTLLCIDGRLEDATAGVKRKIPRPANAFMLFANEWRKKLAAENPRESNKDISVRLGIFWKNMSKDVKEKYFALAREVDAEHKRKYPGS